MKKLLLPAVIITTVLLQFACKKEITAPLNTPCTNCTPTDGNKPPKAYAGDDQQIYFPADSVVLNGMGTDDDGSVVSYFWTKLSGPAATIDSANTAQAIVKNMVQGVYYFELTVTDNLGATGKDHVYVTVSKTEEILHSNWFSLDTSAAAGEVYYDSTYFIASYTLFPDLQLNGSNVVPLTFTKLLAAGIPAYKRHENPLFVSIQLPQQSNPFVFNGIWEITSFSHGGTFFYQELYNPSKLHLEKVAFMKVADLLISYEYRCFLIPKGVYNTLNINWNNYLEVVAAFNIAP